MKKLVIILISAAFSFSAFCSSAAELRKDHPEFHVVQPGDTLWDISALFLQSPWLWPEIWHVNEQVDNPHLIFPGDVLSLVYVDGQRRITKSNKLPNGTIKLSPHIRELTADQAITTIPLDSILAFLTSARVLDQDQLDKAPYIVGSDSERLLAAQDHKVYVRGIENKAEDNYSFFRIGDRYIDPDTNEYLGTEAIHLGEGLRIQSGDPSVVRIKKSVQELRENDRAWPTNDDQLRPTYFPRSPEGFNGGQIISVYGGVEQIGQFDVVVINRGERENMEVGYVMDIFQKGKTIVDKIATKRHLEDDDVSTWEKVKNSITNTKETVTLPDERAGRLMIFRTFEKVSLGLVLSATRTIHTFDKVKTPE